MVEAPQNDDEIPMAFADPDRGQHECGPRVFWDGSKLIELPSVNVDITIYIYILYCVYIYTI